MWIARWVALVAAVLVALSGAAVASADTTTVGETTLTANNADLDDFGQNIPVFQGDSSGNYVLSSASGGHRYLMELSQRRRTAGAQFALRILRPSGSNWTAIATSNPVSVTTASGTDAVNGPFPTSLAIAAGDRMALQAVGADGDDPIETGVRARMACGTSVTPFADGSTSALPDGATDDNGQVVPVQATVTYNAPPPTQTLTVTLAGTGTGTVTGASSPAINCPGTCSGVVRQRRRGQSHRDAGGRLAVHRMERRLHERQRNLRSHPRRRRRRDRDVRPSRTTARSTRPRRRSAARRSTTRRSTATSAPGPRVSHDLYGDLVREPVLQVVASGHPPSGGDGFAYTVATCRPDDSLFCTVRPPTPTAASGPLTRPPRRWATVPVTSPFLPGNRDRLLLISPRSRSPAHRRVQRLQSGQLAALPVHVHLSVVLAADEQFPGQRGPPRRNPQVLQMTGDLQAGYLVCQVQATNAAGTGTALSNRTLVAQPDLGFHVNAMEITQGIRRPSADAQRPGPVDETVSYQGDPLPGSSRVARR